MAQLLSYKCPNCGGDLRFDPAKGDYQCEYCRSRFTQEALDAVTEEKEREEKEKAAKEGAEQSAAKPEGTEDEAVVYNCPSCGAQIVTEKSTAATFCYYCHNPVILTGRLEGKYRPDYVVPFAIDRKKALDIFNNWIAQKKFVPKAFYDKDQIEKFSGVYFPYHLYSCRIEGHIDGQGTRRETTRTGDYENITTGIYHVRRDGDMPVKNVARNALKKANRILVEGVQPYDFSDLKPFSMPYLSGFFAEKRDIESAEIEREVDAEVKEHAMQQLRASIAGYEDLRITDDALEVKDRDWKYALLPVWTVTYKEPGSGKIYYFSMNGQNGKVIGELPVDRNALMAYFFKIAVPVFAVMMAVSYFIG